MGGTFANFSVNHLMRTFKSVNNSVRFFLSSSLIKQEEQGSGRGDNYTATLYRIHLKGYRKCLTDGKKQKWEKTVICKRLPENEVRREAYKSDKLFR